MIKVSLLLFLLASLFFFFYPDSEDDEEKMTACIVSDEETTHSCYIRCRAFGDHWRGCCVPLDNTKESLIQEEFGRCACCQRDYSKNRDFCSALMQGECPTLYDQSMCFYMQGQSGRKRYCDSNKVEMQREAWESRNGTGAKEDSVRRKKNFRKRIHYL